MSPSSLIFVVVIATWAGYLVLHVARRREHLATARNVDRFSEHMRVLQRRAVRNAPRTRLKSSVQLLRTTTPERRVVTASVTVPEAASNSISAADEGEVGLDVRDGVPTGHAEPPVSPHQVAVADTAGDMGADQFTSDNQSTGATAWPLSDAPAETPLAGTDHPAIALTWPFEVLSGLATFSTRLFRAAVMAVVLG
ncbi:MAG TPA: hypothetical protein VES01_06205, partial [Dermatophilaceae bacterium]|nr:hypothetical protein [Dermatophilaceae bacterium]